jgi:hypothetical protein
MEIPMTRTTPEHNKALVLEAFDTLFNKRDYEAAARFWSDTYIPNRVIISFPPVGNEADRVAGCDVRSVV